MAYYKKTWLAFALVGDLQVVAWEVMLNPL